MANWKEREVVWILELGIWDFRRAAAAGVADGIRTRNNQNHNLGLYR